MLNHSFYLVGDLPEKHVIRIGGGGWKCGVCGLQFLSKVDWCNHALVAHPRIGITFAECHVCLRNLRTEPSLKEHLRLCHGITSNIKV